jgi:flagellar hook-associated protein 2
MNLTSLGVGSGLDLESIVTAFIDAEAVPQEIRLQNKEEKLTLELSGVGSFKSSLSSFDSILKKLTAADAFNKQLIDVSTEDIEVTSNGFASNGNFNIEVEALATGSRLQSQTYTSSTDTVGAGTLTFGSGAETFDIVVDATDDLSAIRDKINEQSDNFGVTANIINGDSGSFLVFNSEVTGTANNLTITSADPSLAGISTNNTVEQVAQDAVIYVDGNKITNSSNEFKNVIEDVTITAKKENLGSPATLSIAQDEENGTELITEFVDGFNELMTNLTGLGAPKQGRLAFDPNLRQVKQQLTDLVINSVSGLTGGLDSLSEIGIDITRTGTLEISSVGTGSLLSGKERLSAALENNLAEVGQIFASANGVATKMSEAISTYTGTDGTLTQRESSLNEQLSGIEGEYADLEAHLRDYEDTLRKRFTYLDNTVAQYNATASYLDSALAGLSGNNKD